jgi:hypothetical protein
MVTYQFEIDDDDWADWKDTVPRSKALDVRLRELIQADAEGRVSSPAPKADGSPAADPEPAPAPSQAGVAPEVREQLRDELAGSGDLLERRVDAVVAMYNLLRDRGEAEKDELLDTVDVDATGYQDETSVWSNMVKGKKTLSALPGVETPPTGRTKWRYDPDA